MTDATPHSTARHKAHAELLRTMQRHNSEVQKLKLAKGLLAKQDAEKRVAVLHVVEVNVHALRCKEWEGE